MRLTGRGWGWSAGFAPATAAFVALLVSGCVTSDESGVKPVPLPSATPRVVGAANGEEQAHAQLVAAFGGAYKSPRVEGVLNDIIHRLVAASDDPSQSYKVTILNNQSINAFALPSGHLYVTRGLLALANDTSEIAAVMAHEIGHVTARHAVARGELERNADLVRRVSVDLLNDQNSGAQARARSRLTLASFSRQQELEADQIGVRTMAKAGYDPYGSVRFLTSLGRSSGLRASGRVDFLATHPSTPERIQRATAAARQIGGPGLGEHGREPWLKAIDGMTYGDEPGEGMIRGRRYLNPAVGYRFTAPDGFILERSGQAVIGRASSGLQAMRFDRVAPESGQSLEDYLKSGLLEGVAVEDVRGMQVSGMPAAVGVGRSKDWNYRLGVVEMSGSLYRMLFSAQSLTPEIDKSFVASIESFQTLSPDEARAAKQTKITIVTAQPGDTAATLAQRMAVSDNAEQRFLVLNGLDGPNAVKAGESYKIIVE
ncbi:M48 family metalloprotease [Terrarubrum flagellatum]|uniref:M48 family metalloprotease n=1 Tax=Terrirubrum flagellatum TaxID=2895980 RepID=UPI003144E8A0